ncbi:hypothetical protein QE429_003782 [Bacillus sp. SORGH_AS 510]|uniref:DUF6230 family protein n=1 Tax=Bacillus sp. SORGH_AS_0510 TaxID=3041771 RepID=UPI0027815198|nr:DUF6230 family protein [Bacillus sp. SORGH_AS_0510]MDQ1146955.1 hypothetical protein [Bacillus sp. SORGH_AS_0510]
MNLATETVIIGGQTVKKRLLFALLGGFVFFGSLLGLFGVTGVAAAVPLSGVGEFTVSFDKMVGKDFQLLGGMADSVSRKNNPVAVNKIQHATIYGLEISKEITIPGLPTFRVVIESKNPDSPVEIDGLLQKATVVTGDAVFTNMEMKETYVADKDPLTQAAEGFTQSANTITINKGVLKTLYLWQDKVSLSNMKVFFEIPDKN